MPVVGEKHHNVKHDDKMVEKIRTEYVPYVNGMKKLSKKYNIPIPTIRDWLNYTSRRAAGG